MTFVYTSSSSSTTSTTSLEGSLNEVVALNTYLPEIQSNTAIITNSSSSLADIQTAYANLNTEITDCETACPESTTLLSQLSTEVNTYLSSITLYASASIMGSEDTFALETTAGSTTELTLLDYIQDPQTSYIALSTMLPLSSSGNETFGGSTLSVRFFGQSATASSITGVVSSSSASDLAAINATLDEI